MLRDVLPIKPSDFLPGRRNRTGNGKGRPQQKIEEFDPPVKQAKGAAPTKATPGYLEARVPDGVEVWFDGEKTTETGAVRRFETPPIEPGETRSVVVRARRKAATQDIDEIRHVTLRAGQRLTIDMVVRAERGLPPPPKTDKP
jgi:uncharacterized protein (TIGR03000 family)